MYRTYLQAIAISRNPAKTPHRKLVALQQRVGESWVTIAEKWVEVAP